MAQEHDEHVKPKTISDLSHMDWNFKAGLKKYRQSKKILFRFFNFQSMRNLCQFCKNEYILYKNYPRKQKLKLLTIKSILKVFEVQATMKIFLTAITIYLHSNIKILENGSDSTRTNPINVPDKSRSLTKRSRLLSI